MHFDYYNSDTSISDVGEVGVIPHAFIPEMVQRRNMGAFYLNLIKLILRSGMSSCGSFECNEIAREVMWLAIALKKSGML